VRSASELNVTLRRQVHVGINISGSLRPDIDFPEPFDVDHAFYVENGHFSIPPECHCPWWATLGDAVVEKLIVDALPGYQHRKSHLVRMLLRHWSRYFRDEILSRGANTRAATVIPNPDSTLSILPTADEYS